MKPTITILGAGPSAAFAYRACRDYGITPKIVADQRMRPAGAFWLHSLPPSIPRKIAKALSMQIVLIPLGDAETYKSKMWGPLKVETSFPTSRKLSLNVYSPRGLEHLWDSAEFSLGHKLTDEDICKFATRSDLIIQTFPSRAAKRKQPQIIPFKILVKHLSYHLSTGLCLYNGVATQPWVRSTLAFDKFAFEYPPDPNLNESNFEQLGQDWTSHIRYDLPPQTQPLKTSLLADNIVLAGRYAQWNRKMLAHEVYPLVCNCLIERFGDGN